MNIVVIQGVLSRAPELRELPSGDRLAQFEVTIRHPDRPTASVPVALFDPPDRVLGLAAGADVVATGEVRRRFFRTPAGTGSRTEVVADQVIPASQRKRVRTALDSAIGALEAGGG
ncbi:MAG: single-stranded DNA-binding protein [Aquihabitans sp.]